MLQNSIIKTNKDKSKIINKLIYIKNSFFQKNQMSRPFNYLYLQFDYSSIIFNNLSSDKKLKIILKIVACFIDKNDLTNRFENIFPAIDLSNEDNFLEYYFR